MKDERTGCIYKITCLINGNTYIGLTIQKLSYRFNKHMNSPNPKMKIDIDKYGRDNFSIEPITMDDIPRSNLACVERYYIDIYNPEYNMIKGGSLGGYITGDTFAHSNEDIKNARIDYKTEKYTYKELGDKYTMDESFIKSIVYGHQREEAGGPILPNEPQIGESHYKAKISDINIVKIRELWDTNNYSQPILANMFETNQAYISKIVLGKTRESAGGIISEIRNINTIPNEVVHLSDSDIVKVREIYSEGKYTQEEIGKQFGIPGGTVSNIVLGKQRENAGGPIADKKVGEKHPSCKIPDTIVIEIRTMYSTGKYTQQKLADIYNTTKGNISQLILGKRRGKVGGPIKGVDY